MEDCSANEQNVRTKLSLILNEVFGDAWEISLKYNCTGQYGKINILNTKVSMEIKGKLFNLYYLFIINNFLLIYDVSIYYYYIIIIIIAIMK